VVALKDQDGGARIRAFLSFNGARPSLIELKRFSAEALPIYMVPDDFVVRDALPKTSTDKIDYQRLMRNEA
jgi:non-ribosomal peptide synthetase component E (peptide arylation enzyme)